MKSPRSFPISSIIVRNSPHFRPQAFHIPARNHLLTPKLMPFRFISSFFNSSPAEKMSYPDQRSEEEWRMVLNKGKNLYKRISQKPAFLNPILPRNIPLPPLTNDPTRLTYNPTTQKTNQAPQNNSASSAKKAPNPPALANTTSTTRTRASTPAPAARPHCTAPPTNSAPAAAGLPTSTASPVPSSATRTARSA